jgi:hypothetical protein
MESVVSPQVVPQAGVAGGQRGPFGQVLDLAVQLGGTAGRAWIDQEFGVDSEPNPDTVDSRPDPTSSPQTGADRALFAGLNATALLLLGGFAFLVYRAAS